ncbi:hypothetical protein ONQ97_27930, partial [Salmonella enterica subsp. enterica serovar Virginia]|nr:hypothetical protein [Salmonella enterica subsp. enterica serovar Virginia]
GMTFWQRLRWVEIPMALPVIFGGIRTAVVMNIGVMAIAAVIGVGAAQVLLSAAVLAGLLMLADFLWQAAVVGGIGLAMSSTA